MAFPEPERLNTNDAPLTEQYGYRERGMTLRDYFAAAAANMFTLDKSDIEAIDRGAIPRHLEAAKFCYGFADAMLEVRGGEDA